MSRIELRAQRTVALGHLPALLGQLTGIILSRGRGAVRHRQGFALIVGDEYEGHARLTLDGFEFGPHMLAEPEVQGR